MGRDSLANIARQLIKNDLGETIPKSYGAKVYGNDNEIYIAFDLPIRYVPLDSAYHYGCTVTLVNKSINLSPLTPVSQNSNSKDFPFHNISKEEKRKVEYVLNSKTGKTWSFENYRTYFQNIGAQVTLYEHASFFEVIEETTHERTRYEVTKKTGVVSALRHRHIANLPPWQERGYYEIKK
ncbi:hypothetical protein [Flagellimonas sp.]|uniref:hypothetical protein n=1 Tax=Flagellimonas sp. TaxID=2058762 RepID=UPI003F4A072C